MALNPNMTEYEKTLFDKLYIKEICFMINFFKDF